jgi:excisionase family DNA binding protein
LFLDAEQVAELLGTTPKQVRKLARGGSLPSICVGRYLRVRREWVERWIDEQAEVRR